MSILQASVPILAGPAPITPVATVLGVLFNPWNVAAFVVLILGLFAISAALYKFWWYRRCGDRWSKYSHRTPPSQQRLRDIAASTGPLPPATVIPSPPTGHVPTGSESPARLVSFSNISETQSRPMSGSATASTARRLVAASDGGDTSGGYTALEPRRLFSQNRL
jgi:hypothetical protein